MLDMLKNTFIGRDGTDYRSGFCGWLSEAVESFFCFFGVIGVGCVLMIIADLLFGVFR